jgi:hypothetical protein
MQPLVACYACCSGSLASSPLCCRQCIGTLSFQGVLLILEDHLLQHCPSAPITPPPTSRLWTQCSCTWFQFARPPVLLFIENVAIEHHPGYDVERYLFSVTHYPTFIQISVQHHVWRVDATHKLVVGCDDVWFICGLPPWLPCTSSSLAVAWLERRMTEFFVISSHGKHMREGDQICNTFLFNCRFVP